MNAPVAFLPAPVPISMLPKAGVSPVPVPAATDLIPLAIWDANKLGTGVGGWRTAATTINQLFASASGLGPFGPAGPTHSVGLVPDPGSVAGLGRALFDDGTWKTTLTANSPTLTGKLTVNNNAVQPTALFNSQVASTGISTLQVNQDWSSISGTNLLATFTAYGDAARVTIRGANGTQATPGQTTVGNALGNVNFRGYASSGFIPSAAAGISAIAQESFTNTAFGADLLLNANGIGNASVMNLLLTGTGVLISGTQTLTWPLQADSLLTINANTAPNAVAPTGGTLLHLMGPDGSSAPTIQIEGFGNFTAGGIINVRQAGGTNAVKGPSLINSVIAGHQAGAFDGNTYNTITNFRQMTAEAQDPTHHGGMLTFAAVPMGQTGPPVEIMRISGSGVNICRFPPAAAMSDAPLTVNANLIPSAVAPSPGTVIHAVGVDVSPARVVVDSVGGIASFQGRRTDGNMTAMTPVAANVGILNHGAQAWDGSAFQPTCSTQWATAEAQDATHHGSYISFFTTALALGAFTTAPEVLRVQPSGGLSVGSANVTIDPGNGKILAGGAGIGAAVAPDALLTINANTAAGPAPLAQALLHIVGSDTQIPRLVLDSFFNIGPILNFRQAGSPMSSPVATPQQTALGIISAIGYTGTAYAANGPAITFTSNEQFSSGHMGGNISFSSLGPGATTPVAILSATSTGLIVGSGVNVISSFGANSDALLTLNANTAAAVTAPVAGTQLHMMGPDGGTSPTIQFSGFNTAGGVINVRHAANTNASKVATAVGTVISAFQTATFDGTSYNTVTNIRTYAAENQGPSNHGSYISLGATPNGTAPGVSEVMRVGSTSSGGAGGIGVSIANTGQLPDCLLTISKNANMSQSPPPYATVALHIVGADGSNIFQIMEGYGSYPVLDLRRADGTNMARSAVASGVSLGSIEADGWDGVGWGAGAIINFDALGAWSASNHGSFVQFITIPQGTTTPVECMRLWGSGGLSVGSGLVGTDLGNGVVLANRLQSTSYGDFASSLVPPAGGVGGGVVYFGSTSAGLFIGTGAPTVSASKGSLYIQTDATTATSRLWVNTSGATTWANFTASA